MVKIPRNDGKSMNIMGDVPLKIVIMVYYTHDLMEFYTNNGIFMGFTMIQWNFIVIQWDMNGIYPLVNQHNYGKSQLVGGAITISKNMKVNGKDYRIYDGK